MDLYTPEQIEKIRIDNESILKYFGYAKVEGQESADPFTFFTYESSETDDLMGKFRESNKATLKSHSENPHKFSEPFAN